jgi:hypothetical protein
MGNRQPSENAADRGQATLEYALLTGAVVILSIGSYMTGWFSGLQTFVHDVLLMVSLPIP